MSIIIIITTTTIIPFIALHSSYGITNDADDTDNDDYICSYTAERMNSSPKRNLDSLLRAISDCYSIFVLVYLQIQII